MKAALVLALLACAACASAQKTTYASLAEALEADPRLTTFAELVKKVRAPRGHRTLQRRQRRHLAAAVAALPPLARAQPNWPAPTYPQHTAAFNPDKGFKGLLFAPSNKARLGCGGWACRGRACRRVLPPLRARAEQGVGPPLLPPAGMGGCL